LFLDGVLIYTLPGHLIGRFTGIQAWVMMGGVCTYLAVQFLVRKPERLYLWGHELTHLLVAKLFLRQVHGFHITSRTGGKVVIDRTNVAIDLAPYAVPFYNAAALGPILFLQGRYRYAGELYLAAAAFFFTMHLFFSLEGFLHKQPDLKRSGRVFSGAVVLLFLLLWLPLLGAPGTTSGFHGLLSLYREWIGSGFIAMKDLLTLVRSRTFF
jgi:hypothetical protein